MMTDARRPTYLDHNATTPVSAEVLAAMLPYFTERFGNPSSAEHVYGQEAAAAVEVARRQVADSLSAEPAEVIFTGSCTEANNIAIFGVARATNAPAHFITSQIEHPAVLESFRQLEREGHAVTYLGVDLHGQIDVSELRRAFRSETLLVSIMVANNEVGTLQHLAQIGSACEEAGVLFHADLAQALAYCELNLETAKVQLASISAHKAYGPKGIGALYVQRRRPRIRLMPITFGGGQERGLRPGTLSTPLIVGMGAACEQARVLRRTTADHSRTLRDKLQETLSRAIEGLQVNGHPIERLPNTLSLSIEGVEPLALMRLLRNEICFSASSACSSDTVHTSHVLLAMFGDSDRARAAFRLAVGRYTTDAEVGDAADRLVDGVQRLRAFV